MTDQRSAARQAVLVLGMHRSGTSATAGILARLGARAPSTLMSPDRNNPAGYGESRLLCQFHDELLGAAATSWDAWTRIDAAWFTSQMANVFDHRLRHLLSGEFGRASLFVVKDPRMCRLVPFWHRHLVASEVQPKAIITLRSPGEVAASLRLRDGIDTPEALLMWLRHVLDAERDTRTIPRSFVRYRELLDDWRAVAARVARELELEWHLRPDVEADIDAFLSPALSHHHLELEDALLDPPLRQWVTSAWAALNLPGGPDARRAGEVRQILDDVRGELDAFARVFGPSVELARQANRLVAADLKAERAAQRQQVEAWSMERSALQAEVDRSVVLRGELTDTRRELAETRTEVADSRRELANARRELADARDELAHIRRELVNTYGTLSKADHDLYALLNSWSWRLTSPARLILRPLVHWGRKRRADARD